MTLRKKTLVSTFSPKCVVDHLGAVPKGGNDDAVLVVAACKNEARIYDSATEELHASVGLGDNIVAMSVHPTNKHFIVATRGGKLHMIRLGAEANDIKHVAIFSSDDNDGSVEYACGEIHPDGLLYAVGTTTGKIQLWDLKSKNLAATLEVRFFYYSLSWICL